jgi:hypothetical protein
MDWEQSADTLADQIGQELAMEVVRSRLNPKLMEFKLMPARAGAAQMTITVSPSEVIVTAGRGTRFELDPLPSSGAETLQLVRSVSNGHLTEHIRRGVVNFELRVDEQTLLTGRSGSSLIATDSPQTVDYLPYGPSI